MTAGQPLLTLHTDTPERFARALSVLEGGWDIAAADGSTYGAPLILDRLA